MSDWIKIAKSGDKVVCIKQDAWIPASPGRDNLGIFPQCGEIYVIQCLDAFEDKVFLGLVGIDGWYWSEHFKPIDNRQADISVFKAMLKTAPTPALEDA